MAALPSLIVPRTRSPRSFDFEKYSETENVEYARRRRRRLTHGLRDMADWVLGDPTATNLPECAEYVTEATANGNDDAGLFAHDSEHTSFRILTPTGKIRLSHGRLHRRAMRDPTDRFNIPDHEVWQINLLAIEHDNVYMEATGDQGETLVPTLDDRGVPTVEGMRSNQGSELECE